MWDGSSAARTQPIPEPGALSTLQPVGISLIATSID
jgi:hypothetical protein